MAQPVSFAEISAKAWVMNLHVRQPGRMVYAPRNRELFDHSESWVVSLKSGPHELVVAEQGRRDGKFAECEVSASDVAGEEMKRELVTAMKLGVPLQETESPDGKQRLTVWRYAEDTLRLIDGTPVSFPGISLKLTHQINVGR
jgi:hypothetical protein